MATKSKTNQNDKEPKSLETQLWETAEQLRGSVEASEYKYIGLGLMFLKFISDRFEERKQEISDSAKSEKQREFLVEDKDEYLKKGVFFLPKDCRWDKLQASAASEKNLGLKIDKMLLDVEKENSVLSGVLPIVYGRTTLANENLAELVNLFSDQKFGTKDAIHHDTFGKAYEFFIKKFAKEEGRRGGEFYTPKSVVQLLVEILEPYEGRIYDPTCGSGGMFVQSLKFIESHQGKKEKTAIYGQEVKDGIWRICKMNLALRGIDTSNIYLGNSLKNDKFPENKKANRIIANPPFNMKEWGYSQLSEDKRWTFGTPAKNNANFAFMQHMLYHLDEKVGRMGLVLANGSMSAGGIEGEIRKRIIEADLVDCMIALPSNLFFTTTIPACLWFFTKNKDDKKTRKRKGETLFIDARKIFTPISRVQNALSDIQIQDIADTYSSYIGEKGKSKYKDVAGYCKISTIGEIAKNNFVLTPGRYVGAEEVEDDDEPFEDKMKGLLKEFGELSEQSKILDKEIRKNMKVLGFEI